MLIEFLIICMANNRLTEIYRKLGMLREAVLYLPHTAEQQTRRRQNTQNTKTWRINIIMYMCVCRFTINGAQRRRIDPSRGYILANGECRRGRKFSAQPITMRQQQ